MKELIVNGVIFRRGTDAKDNTQLIKDSCPGWTWFHLTKFASCHLVVCQDEIDESIIASAAALVKEHSKYKFKHIGVSYCKIKNLTHGEKPGSVHYVSKGQVKNINI
jgi:predicted ribosome quality control (RQC) complex YloA/Tae2 family protein